ncbi:MULTISPECIES: DUF4247 domain-containing protein [unclassified Paenibacillus]|uniref:DUF4247 domain-containing protein n=1 Tax=unclassified Paenibacillus TaxID=185978 RepID=UPI00089642E1|nr:MULTISPECIES: DUF4247 domain-containing protein [unclassified Paenibacillus]OMC68383.1 hypothetical protein BK126_11115 [Paenibacillus sp. FSL H7-0326]SDW63225.1 protein of unknown function [Paenibacillus sp. PDC88]
MNKRFFYMIKIVLVLSLFVSVLSGCGTASAVKESYPLESVNGSGNSTSYVYRAAGMTVPEVADELMEERSPEEVSPQDTERMFLVYPDELYHLQQDPEAPEDTLIEVDSQEYVRQNYSSSFLQGYITASILDSMFDSLKGAGKYRGYTTQKTYKPSQGTYRTPTDNDKSIAPPLTTNKSGSIIRRGLGDSGDTSKSTSGNSVLERGSSSSSSSSKGKIERGKSSGSSIFSSPKKSSRPKTKIGSGRITRRR